MKGMIQWIASHQSSILDDNNENSNDKRDPQVSPR